MPLSNIFRSPKRMIPKSIKKVFSKVIGKSSTTENNSEIPI